MTAPTFKKATDSATDGTNVKYGAPDVKYAADVLDGTHVGGHRIQHSVIEGRNRYAPYLYLIRPANGDSEDVEIINGANGNTDFQGEFPIVFNQLMNSLPDLSVAGIPGPCLGTIVLQGNLDVVTNTVVVSRPVILDGLGTANVRKTGSYEGDLCGIFSLRRGNTVLRNFTITDVAQTGPYGVALPGGSRANQCRAIVGRIPYTVKNWLFENLHIKDAYYHCLSLGSKSNTEDGRYCENIMMRNCWFDHTTWGACCSMGFMNKNITVENCRFTDSAHSALEFWGNLPHSKAIGNLIERHNPVIDWIGGGGTENPTYGQGIYASTVADHTTTYGRAEDVIIRDNVIVGDYWDETAISVHGEAKKVVIENNIIDTPNGEYGIRLKSDVTPSDEPFPGGYYGHETLIYNNTINGPWHGININQEPPVEGSPLDPGDPTTADMRGFIIVGNTMRNLKRRGISSVANLFDSVICNNIIMNYGTDTAFVDERMGIYLRLSSSTRNVVTGNIIIDNGVNTPQWSIWANDGTDNLIANNIVDRPIKFSNTNVIGSDNLGFKTEATGTATVASGSTSTSPTHGLAYTPTLAHIKVTPTNNLGSASTFWISNPTSSAFTINVNTAPGGSGATFVWKIARI